VRRNFPDAYIMLWKSTIACVLCEIHRNHRFNEPTIVRASCAAVRVPTGQTSARVAPGSREHDIHTCTSPARLAHAVRATSVACICAARRLRAGWAAQQRVQRPRVAQLAAWRRLPELRGAARAAALIYECGSTVPAHPLTPHPASTHRIAASTRTQSYSAARQF